MEENGIENNQNDFREKPAEKFGERKCTYSKELLCVLLAAFFGGFLAMYFVTDQVLYRQYKRGMIMPENIELRMMKDFDKMYRQERKAFERNFGRFEKDFGGGYEYNKKNPFRFPDKWISGGKNKDNPFDTSVNPFAAPDLDGVKIKTEIEDDKYKVIIGLKAFQGDGSRINYNAAGRKLTVFGSSGRKEKNFEQNISFSQDFLLPDNADTVHIKKEQDGDKLVIEVPLL